MSATLINLIIQLVAGAIGGNAAGAASKDISLDGFAIQLPAHPAALAMFSFSVLAGVGNYRPSSV